MFCDKEGAMYLLKCKICSEEYIGESQRAIRTRIGEHHNQARNRYTETAWGEHMNLHPTVQVGKDTIFTASLVTIEEKPAKLKVREALEIQHRQSEQRMGDQLRPSPNALQHTKTLVLTTPHTPHIHPFDTTDETCTHSHIC